MKDCLLRLTEAVIEKYNPCKIVGSGCIAGDPVPCCSGKIASSVNCNGVCKSPGLDCRIWFCRTALSGADKDCVDTIKDIERIAIRYGLIGHPYLYERYCGENRF